MCDTEPSSTCTSYSFSASSHTLLSIGFIAMLLINSEANMPMTLSISICQQKYYIRCFEYSIHYYDILNPLRNICHNEHTQFAYLSFEYVTTIVDIETNSTEMNWALLWYSQNLYSDTISDNNTQLFPESTFRDTSILYRSLNTVLLVYRVNIWKQIKENLEIAF